MKNKIFIIILTFLFVMSACSSSQKTENKQLLQSKVEKIVYNSKSLNKNMNVNIYFPPGYDKEKKYPVLYLIHGYNSNEGVIYNFSPAADKLLLEGKIEPLLIVAPKVDNSYGINSPDGMYEDYIYKEIISYMDLNYNTIPSKESRYIGGSSMGGYIALHIGFRHPELFSKVGGHQPAIYTENPGRIYPAKYDPINIAKTKDLSGLQVYLDDGKNDHYGFYKGCEALYNILSEKGVKVQNHLNEGEHNQLYLQQNAEKYMLFYSAK